MPAAVPAPSIPSTIHPLVASLACNATPPAPMAPRMNCPSAPMFQTLLWKHTARPSPIRSSGTALSDSSASARGLESGSMKKSSRPRHGSLPSQTNIATHRATVITSANTGDKSAKAREGSPRGSSLSPISPALNNLGLRVLCAWGDRWVPQAAHPLADLFHADRVDSHARRQAAARDHDQAVADLEELIEIFAHHEYRGTGLLELQELGSDLCRGAHVDAPRGLSDDEHLGVRIQLATHDELLEVATGQALGGCSGVRGFHLKARYHTFGQLLQPGSIDETAAPDRLAARQESVLRER